MSHFELTTTRFRDAKGFPATRLSTSHANIIRLVWIVIVSITFVLCVAGLITGFGQLRELCTGTACHPLQLDSEQAMWNEALGLSLNFYAVYTTVTLTVFSGVCFIVGFMIFWYIPDNWMGLYVSLFLIAFGVGTVPIFTSLQAIMPQVQWWGTFMWIIGGWSLPVILYIFPNGRFVPSWLRWLLLAWIVYNLVLLFTEPLPQAGILSGPPSLFTQIVFVVGGLSQIYRYRQTDEYAQRLQTKWAILGFLGHQISLIAIVSALNLVPLLQKPGVEKFFFDTYAFAFFGLLPILFIPLSLAFCILRYHLWDIDVVINRTVVYSILTVVIIGLYTTIVGGFSIVFHSDNNPPMSLLATGVVAVSFHTIRDKVQRTINRIMFGYRDEHYVVLERLSRQLEPVVLTGEVLPTITNSIGDALNLPYVAIALMQDGHYEIHATYPDNENNPKYSNLVRLPLDYRSEHIGQLWLAPRGKADTFSVAESELLATIARQASIAAYNVRLTEELQRSREMLVTTLEDERRRLRRDLHDGLGPVLASISLGLDAIRNLADTDSATTEVIATELKQQVQSSLSEVRRIAYALRPPALDELGLVGALREHFNMLNQAHHLKIKFTATAKKLALPAAVEVAAYRIALEAVTNVQHHADASTCYVDLTLMDMALSIRVADDGQGIPDDYRAGVGMTSMRERAEELGGQCKIIRQNPGLLIEAILPVS